MQLPSLNNSDLLAVEREFCSRSLRNFVKRAWPQIIPQELQYNWHIDAVCDHMQAVATGDITRLLINIPPGTSKSTLSGVMFPAWMWGPNGRPQYKYIGAAHEQNLAVRDNRMMRELILSEWYQALWPIKLMGDQNEKLYFENKDRGFRQACAVGSMTGRRGDCITWDDPLSPEKSHSETSRETALRVFKETLPTRLTEPSKSAIIVIMQRLHDDDPSGYIIAKNLGYDHLMIPMEYEPERKSISSIGWTDPRTVEGELLDPVRFSAEVIKRDKLAMGSYAWAGQMQQRPSPAGGGIVKIHWFQRYKEIPAIPDRIIISWDTAAKEKEINDPSVGTVWAVYQNNYYLIDVVKGRWSYPTLKHNVIGLSNKWTSHAVLIEDKSTGEALIPELKQSTSLPVIAIMPVGDKVTRMSAETSTIEAGRVFLPEEAPWLLDYEQELVSFPEGKRDQADSTSQFLRYMREIQSRSQPRIRRFA